jgi:peroxiredoxin
MSVRTVIAVGGLARLGLATLLCTSALAATQPVDVDIDKIGPQVGALAPAFSGHDQFGREQTLETIMERRGAMVVFFRSADWWPYCKTQLVELQARYGDITQQGLGLVAISYDSPATLQAFAQSRGITFPLISDSGSTIIRRFGLLNETVDRASKSYGVPHPGTFILDREGRVKERYFEEAYQERYTSANILVRQGFTPRGPVRTLETPHVTLTAAVSDAIVAPGERLSLVLDVTPRPGMHVYAPGAHVYNVAQLSIEPRAWLRAALAVYPPSEIYHFKPLDERVEVYSKPFRLVQDVTILASPDVQKLLALEKQLTIDARFEYQACDDRLCYMPQSVPIRWTVELRTLDRK